MTIPTMIDELQRSATDLFTSMINPSGGQQ